MMPQWFELTFADGMVDAIGIDDPSWVSKDERWLTAGVPAGDRWGPERRVLLAGGEDDRGRRVKHPRLYDQVPSGFFGVVASARATDAVLKVAPGEIEALKVRGTLPAGEIVTSYLWNILNVLRCLSREASDIDRFPDNDPLPYRRGLISYVRKATIDLDAVGGRNIVRDVDYLGSVYVSEVIKTALEGIGASGFGFVPINVTSGGADA